MIRQVHYPGNHHTETIVTEVCSICGAVNGEDFVAFARHLELNHSAEEVGL